MDMINFLTFTYRQRSAPISTRETLYFRRTYQRVPIVARELNFRAHLRGGGAQNQTSSRHDITAMHWLDLNHHRMSVTSRRDACECSRITSFRVEDAQSIFELRISAVIGVPSFGVFSVEILNSMPVIMMTS
jgi:hypothetical protein